jgi:hypothetical protein
LHRIYYTNLSGTMGFEFLFAFFMLATAFMVMMVFLGICLQMDLTIALASLSSLVQTD